MNALNFRACNLSFHQNYDAINIPNGTEEDDDYLDASLPVSEPESSSVITSLISHT